MPRNVTTLSMLSPSFTKFALLVSFSMAASACAPSDNRIKEWVQKNPDVIMQALTDHQRKMQEEGMPKGEDVKQNQAALFENAGSPKAGGGKIKIAYFFDFNCGHCARQSQTMEAILSKKMNVEISYKNFPFLRPDSELLARAALSAHQQGKYKEFYKEIYKSENHSKEGLKTMAKKLGLDVKKWEADLEAPAVTAEIEHVRELAQKMKITGTPVIAIAPDKIFPGRVDQLEDIIQKM